MGGLKHGYIVSKWGGGETPVRQLPAVLAAPPGSPWTDTRNTLRASPAALVAMHSNHPSSRGLGLVMSSEPEVCTLRGHSTRWGQPLHYGGATRKKQPRGQGGYLYAPGRRRGFRGRPSFSHRTWGAGEPDASQDSQAGCWASRVRLGGPGAMAGGTAGRQTGSWELPGAGKQRAAARRCTDESCPEIRGGSRGAGGMRLTFLLTQDTEIQALPVRASRAGGHAEVVAGILHPNRVNVQGAIGQQLQPGEGGRKSK